MFGLRKLLFKGLELSMGLRTTFSLETKDPLFANFRLSAAEESLVRAALPAGFTLEPLRFTDADAAAAYWVSYNFYELKYPSKELASVRKARLEINTFVRDAEGRAGVFVFAGSPYVSKEEGASILGKICDAAESLVIWIYGCGRLLPLLYRPSDGLVARLADGPNHVEADLAAAGWSGAFRLSDDYWRFNDISFFNGGATHDFVYVSRAFFAARFQLLDAAAAARLRFRSAFFDRAPDAVYLHRGEIPYLVNALNRSRP
jgi:hypothetical protein